MTSNVCFSGGAAGADVAWGIIASKNNHQVIHYSFEGHNAKTPDYVKVLTEAELEDADEHLKKASKSLQRPIPFHKPWVANLLRRNYYQVCHTERVYAVSKINRFCDSRSCVDGRTAWAVEMAMDMEVREINVFDQVQNKWFYWNCGGWLEGKPSTPHGHWTGIGSRNISNEGLQAIIDIF